MTPQIVGPPGKAVPDSVRSGGTRAGHREGSEGRRMEPLEIVAQGPPPGRDPITKQFADGNSVSVGRPRGSKNHLARLVQQQIEADLIEHGAAANPVVILLRFARDESIKPRLRIQAAALAAKFIAPKLLQVNVDVDVANSGPEQARLAANPKYRAAAEALMEALAEEAERQKKVMNAEVAMLALPAPGEAA
jgi:hypothetical protein